MRHPLHPLLRPLHPPLRQPARAALRRRAAHALLCAPPPRPRLRLRRARRQGRTVDGRRLHARPGDGLAGGLGVVRRRPRRARIHTRPPHPARPLRPPPLRLLRPRPPRQVQRHRRAHPLGSLGQIKVL